MKILKFSIIIVLLSFMTSCENSFYSPGDKGVVINVKKVDNGNEVTIKIKSYKRGGIFNKNITFLTNKQYNIDDTVYFTK